MPRPDTKAMFKAAPGTGEPSPIDAFVANTNAINKLYVHHLDPGGPPLPRELGTLVLLGYMSAVESYFRTVLRRTIMIDTRAKKSVETMQVSYAAAIHHKPELLPEALLEGQSFAGRKGSIDFVKSALDLSGNLPATVEAALGPFLTVCELRHCCVHRFGKLGSQNAIKLGLDDHSSLIEQPFEPTVDHLQEVADVLRTFVKTINNWLWGELLQRSVRKGAKDFGAIDWTWSWAQDAPVFSEYYALFASQQDQPPSPPLIQAYSDFAAAAGPKGAPFEDDQEEQEAS